MIPPNWTMTSLGAVGVWSGGGTPSKAKDEFWTGGTIPWVSPKDMKVFHIHGAEDTITQAAVEGSATKLVPAGSVLMVVRSGILAHTFPVAVSTVPVTLNQDMKALTPGVNILPEFLAYYLTSSSSKILRDCSKAGTTVASIESSALKAFPLPIPELREQRRIVAAIETHFSRLDAAVASLTRAKANVKRARASVLKAAVEGRLVPTEAKLARSEGRDYEPATTLLKRILAERKAAWTASGARGKYKEPVKPEVDGLAELPEGWCWVSMPQLGELDRGKSKHRPRNDPKLLNGPYPFIQTGDIRHANLFVRNFEATYSAFGLAQSKLWPAGTLCITIAANIAETAILSIDACFPDSIVGFSGCPETSIVRFLELFIRTEKSRLSEFAPATAQKNINLHVLREVAVRLPPLAEQRRIVAEVDRSLSVFDAIEATLDTNLARCAQLRQSILKRAFEGRLVPEEPAVAPPPPAEPQLTLFPQDARP